LIVERRARLVQLMREAELDALVAVSPENVFYLTGVRLLMQRLVPDRYAFALLTEKQVTVVTVHSDADHARRDSIADMVVVYGHTATPIAALAQTIADVGLEARRVGIESGFLPAADFAALSTQLPAARWVPCGGIFREARMRKDVEEVAHLRDGQHRTELAITAAMAMSQEGDTERAMARKIGANFFTYGAEAVDFILLTIGVNSTVFHLLPGDYHAKRGDVVHLDCGASFKSYRSDLSRNVGIGTITARQRDIYAKLWDVQRSVISAMRPGVAVRDLVRRYLDDMARVDLMPPGDHLGHGIGLASHEFPELTLESDAVLSAGMVLAIEPTTFVPGDVRYDIEDVVAVTDAGCDMLSGAFHQRDMWVV
jgi:Xaa-Pro aminopeptidase